MKEENILNYPKEYGASLEVRRNYYDLAVIIPFYNAERFLKRAIQSVLEQKSGKAVLILVDDGSADHSPAIAKEIARDRDDILIVTQVNKGVAAARNAGIEVAIKAGAKYIGFLDSDDAWLKGAFIGIESAIQSNKDVYEFSYYVANEDLSRGRFVAAKEIQIDGTINRWGVSFWAYIYKAEVINRYSIKFPEGVKANEDEAFRYLYLCVSNTGERFDLPILAYRSNPASVTRRKGSDLLNKYKNVIDAWNYIEKELDRLQREHKLIAQEKSDENGALSHP